MTRRFVAFSVAATRCCIPVEQVMQILRPENLLEVPKTPSFVEGVINLHGDILPVIDLRKRLGLPAPGLSENDARRKRIVAVRFGQRFYGLDVDEIREIVELDDSAIRPEGAELLGDRGQFVSAVANPEEGAILVLDLARILDAGRALASEQT